MTGFIPDPVDPDQAIAPSGALAARVYLIPEIADPTRPTIAELQAGRRIGWAEPTPIPIEPDPDLTLKFYYPTEEES